MYGCQQVLVSQDKDLINLLTFLCEESHKLTNMGIYYARQLTKLTPDKVLQAMESIQIADVTAWSKEVFGQSILSQRKLAFSTSINCIKVA